eukprot:EC788284.1.p2 GENE.EC788284.1~~EC788284.1.p2  ORF type:complete len:73 (-),score=1.68 EC788284.1:7-225(-)
MVSHAKTRDVQAQSTVRRNKETHAVGCESNYNAANESNVKMVKIRKEWANENKHELECAQKAGATTTVHANN